MDTDEELAARLQEEAIALITAWVDRGVTPQEATMVLAGLSHMLLAKLGFSLGTVTTMLSDGWRRQNGKL